MFRRLRAEFGDRPRRVHDQFRLNEDDSIRARWPAAARFHLEHFKSAQSRELFGAVHGAGLVHVRPNYGCRADAKHAIHDASEFLMRARKTVARRALALLAGATLLTAPL